MKIDKKFRYEVVFWAFVVYTIVAYVYTTCNFVKWFFKVLLP